MKKVFFVLTLLFSFVTIAQVTPPGFSLLRACDTSNDGVEEVNLNLIFYVIASNEVEIDGSISDYNFVFYESTSNVPIADPVHYMAMDDDYIVFRVFDSNTGDEIILGTRDFFIYVMDDCLDSDGDSIPDIEENLNQNTSYEDDDFDGDTIPNYLDIDDDGDNVLTINEDYDADGNPVNDDINSNIAPDYLDDSATLSIKELVKNKFNLYPNPATSVINIESEKYVNEKVSISIYTIQGKKVLNTFNEAFGYKFKVNISSLTEGLYFVTISNNNFEITKKVIVQ